MGGDGIALWYTKDRMEKGNVFGAKNTFVGKRPELVIEANNRVRMGPGSVAMLKLSWPLDDANVKQKNCHGTAWTLTTAQWHS